MRHSIPGIPAANMEATVCSKGQVTLPCALRRHLGIKAGTRIRFSVGPNGGFLGDRIRYELEDLWMMADQEPRPEGVMAFKEMDEAKVRRQR